MSTTHNSMNCQGVMDSAMTALHLKFFDRFNRWSELQEFSDFVEAVAPSNTQIQEIVHKKFPLAAKEIDRYPDFWEKLAYNIQLETIPRSRRPNRIY